VKRFLVEDVTVADLGERGDEIVERFGGPSARDSCEISLIGAAG